jgi:hypothetical protein
MPPVWQHLNTGGPLVSHGHHVDAYPRGNKALVGNAIHR